MTGILVRLELRKEILGLHAVVFISHITLFLIYTHLDF